jgi:DNA replication protein DnaC
MSEQPPIYGDPAKLEEEVQRFQKRGRMKQPIVEPAPIAVPDASPFAGLPAMIERMKAAHRPRTDEEMRAYHWQEIVLPNLVASKIPPRFHYEITEWKEPKQQAVFRQCQQALRRTGAIVALLGGRGLGKTTIAAQLTIERAWNAGLQPWERRPPYRKMTDLIAKYKPLYADFGGINTEVLIAARDWYCRFHPLVVIDELHECDDQRMKDRVLTDILDRRYANRVDTLLISNQTFDEFKQTTNDSVLSRLKEHGRIVTCTWASFR